MKYRRQAFIGLMLLFVLSGAVHAQSCQWRQEGTSGPGWYDSGGSVCSNFSPQQQSAPVARWASRWGAIAINTHTGALGSSVGRQTKRDAKMEALSKCGYVCSINLTFHDQCAALASGEKFFASASAATIEEASRLAMKDCGKGGVTDCMVTYSECSLPERIQ